MKKFKKPTDITAFWIAPHCAPGCTDPEEECGYCGDTYKQCAEAMTEAIRQGKIHFVFDNTGSGLRDEQGNIDKPPCCGGSGFWCPECGRFWASDVCGETEFGDEQSCDGTELSYNEETGIVSCYCGKELGKVTILEDDNE